jgi:integrase
MKPDYAEAFSLYTRTGARKYLNGAERKRVLNAAAVLAPGERLFVVSLAFTGARISEALALSASSFQIDTGLVAIRTLKRRRHHFREVPIPPQIMAALDRHFHLGAIQRDLRRSDHRLWPWSRTKAWRLVKRVMHEAGLSGSHACPKGLRHAFGVATLGIVPLNIRQKWLGHARPETTHIYSAVCGPEEIAFAARFWNSSSEVEGGDHPVHAAAGELAAASLASRCW